MSGTQLRPLQGPGQVRRVKHRADGVSAVTINNAQAARRQRARRIDDIRDQRLARQGMQHLGQIGIHAFALTSGEDDDVHDRTFFGDG
jgi:hypothetical protein